MSTSEYRIISITPVQPGAYQALYRRADTGVFRAAPVVALAQFVDDYDNERIEPLVISRGGRTVIAGADSDDLENPNLNEHLHLEEEYQGYCPSDQVKELARIWRETGTGKLPDPVVFAS